MIRNAVRMSVAVVVLSLAAAACGGGPTNPRSELRDTAEKYSKMSAGDVKPPDAPDKDRGALPGFILSTNSRSWEKLVGSPNGAGAVVLFIQPGSPTDGKGIARGDLLVGVDGDPIADHERAVALLHSKIGETRKLTFKRKGRKKEREVEIVGRRPRGNPRTVLNPLVEGNPSDPVLRYLRAQSPGATPAQNLADLKVALDKAPDFIEALTLQGSIMWDASLAAKDSKQKRDLATKALAAWKNALDIDPTNQTTLAVRASAYTRLGQAKQAEADARRALQIDGGQPFAFFALSRALQAQNKPQESAGPALGAVNLNPYALQYWQNLASLFNKLKRREDCTKTASNFGSFLRAHSGDAFKRAADQLSGICK